MITEKGVIRPCSMGNFLDPPTYPTHSLRVETDLRRRKGNRGGMSLTAAVDCEWLDPGTRLYAQRLLNHWRPLPLDDPRVVDWFEQVLGYFRNCYRGTGDEPECWHVSNLHMWKVGDGIRAVEDHAGVHLIRKFYPEFTPTPQQWAAAYWGAKP